MTFSEKIKFIRKTLLLSQEALARELGISFGTINRWEAAKFSPNLTAQKKIIELCKKHNIVFKDEV